MSSPGLETFLARLYSDPDLLDRFLADPDGASRGARLSESERAAVVAIDRDGLVLAARSYARKRAMRSVAGARFRSWLGALVREARR